MSFFKRNFWEKLSGKIPDFIKNDPFRKLLAFFLALLLFTYYYTSKETRIEELEVPVEITLPEGYYLLAGKPATAKVRLSCGPFAAKENLKEKVKLNVDLSREVLSGRMVHDVTLKKYAVTERLSDAKVTSVKPANITLRVERQMTKEVKVNVDLTQKVILTEGYEVAKVSCIPDKVILSGPASFLKEIDSISTVEIPFDATIIKSFFYSAKLIPPKDQPLISMTPEKVTVNLTVAKSHSEKTFRQVPVKLLMGSSVDTVTGVQIVSAKVVDVTVTGLKNAVDRISESDLIPYADVSAIRKNGLHNNIPVKCWSRKEGVSIQSVVPDSVNVRVGPQAAK